MADQIVDDITPIFTYVSGRRLGQVVDAELDRLRVWWRTSGLQAMSPEERKAAFRKWEMKPTNGRTLAIMLDHIGCQDIRVEVHVRLTSRHQRQIFHLGRAVRLVTAHVVDHGDRLTKVDKGEGAKELRPLGRPNK